MQWPAMAWRNERTKGMIDGMKASVCLRPQVMARMTSLERSLLAEQLATLRKAFSPGLSVVNWTSLGIPDYAAASRKARAGLPSVRMCRHRAWRRFYACPQQTITEACCG